MSWFLKEKKQVKLLVEGRSVFPMWTFVRVVDSNRYYLLLEKTKKMFISERAFKSWGRDYLLVTDGAIAGLSNNGSLGFSPGTIVHNQADGKQWFITGFNILDQERRLIATPDFYELLGFDPASRIVASSSEVDFHRRSEDIVSVNQ